jgi:hypothetical protein
MEEDFQRCFVVFFDHGSASCPNSCLNLSNIGDIWATQNSETKHTKIDPPFPTHGSGQ